MTFLETLWIQVYGIEYARKAAEFAVADLNPNSATNAATCAASAVAVANAACANTPTATVAALEAAIAALKPAA
jgi:hypothetical protein